MSWREAWNLVGILSKDPASQVGSAIAGWDGPRSAEWLILADLYDLQHKSKAKTAPKPYPRPKITSPDKKKASGSRVGDGRAMLRRLAGGAYQEPPDPVLQGPYRGPDGRFAKRPA